MVCLHVLLSTQVVQVQVRKLRAAALASAALSRRVTRNCMVCGAEFIGDDDGRGLGGMKFKVVIVRE